MIDQSSQFMAILTAIGEAKQANAAALGLPWTFTQMGVGDANGADPQPSRTQTKLINERRRAPLNQIKVDPKNTNVIIAEQVIPENVGGWWIREIGLYDADGDLVAVANCAPSFKPLLEQGTGKTQVVRINFIVTSAANVTLKIDPSVVLATRQYVDDRIIEVLPPTRTPGSYTKVLIDKRGVVIEGSNPDTLAENGIKDAYTKTQTNEALALKAPINSPALTGLPTAPTAPSDSNTQQLANTAFVQAAIRAVIAGAPGALDTLKELAQALGGDPNFANTIINALAGKADKATTLGGYGIADAYTRTYMDELLNLKINRDFVSDMGLASDNPLVPYMRQISTGRNIVLSVAGHGHNFMDLGGKPSTLSGYGITDGYTKAEVNARVELCPLRDNITDVGLVNGEANKPYFRLEKDRSILNLAVADHKHTFSALTEKPTSVAGFGIQDVYTKSQLDELIKFRLARDQITAAGLVAGNPALPYFRDEATDGLIYLGLRDHSHPDMLVTLNAKVYADGITYVGVVSNNKNMPYMRHKDSNDLIRLVAETTLPRNTGASGLPGWWKCGDTGQIRQRVSVLVGDFGPSMATAVTWPIAFPNQCSSVTLTLRQPNTGSPTGASMAYSNATTAGCSIRLDEWAAMVQSTELTLVIEAVGY